MALREDEAGPSKLEPEPEEHGSLDAKEDAEKEVVAVDASLGSPVLEKDGNEIEWRSCSWQKTATLMFSEYICMAILTFPWAYSVLGIIPGILLSIVVSASVCYTSLILWRWCIQFPDTEDICDIGQRLAGGRRWGWWLTAICFCLNNTFIQALHVLMGAKFLNTVTDHKLCTNWMMLFAALACFLCSLPRPFSSLSMFAGLAAVCTLIMIFLATIFAGVERTEAYSYLFESTTKPTLQLWPKKDLTFAEGMTAFLNIAYTFIGQLTLPTFISEMKNPKDFPKVVYAVSLAEMMWAVMAGTLILFWTGADAVKSPAFPTQPTFRLVCVWFALPTIVFLGVLFSTLTAKFVFFQVFAGTKHRDTKTKVSTFSWGAIVASTWIVAFLVAQAIPFFSDMLGLMSSMFDSFLGYMFWSIAWITMRKMDYGAQWFRYSSLRVKGCIELAVNILLFAVGVFFFVPGTYATVQSIIISQKSSKMGGIFSCKDNAF